jgi:beta-fructofuranosidase
MNFAVPRVTSMGKNKATRRQFLGTIGSAAVLTTASPFHLMFVGDQTDAQLRDKLAADPLRPQFHLLPAKNWMNDPNGPIYWKGVYHMFFQYNPNAAVWGDMHWAHAVSSDMIHWRHMPVAMAPTLGGDDAQGCFTGSAVDDHGTATILYTGVSTVAADRATLRDGVNNFREVQCLATSQDRQLRNWRKWKEPVLQPPDDPTLTGFRDPFLWRDGNVWYMGIGSGVRKQGGCVRLYRSMDLQKWEYLHPLASGTWTGHEGTNPVDTGEMWECPDFFALGKKFVLLYSTAGNVIWETGDLNPAELVFHSEKQGILDYGAYYAQKTQLAANGDRILWGWIPEKRPEAEYSAAGWAGCMALPRVLTIAGDGELQMSVAPEARSLRGKSFVLPEAAADRARALRELHIQDLRGEFSWATPGTTSTFTLADSSGPWLSIKMEAEGSGAKLMVNGTSIQLERSLEAEAKFRLFIDASVAELICNDRHAITTRIYRKPDGPLRVVMPDSELDRLTSLELWHLVPISKDRLTT